MLTFSLIAGAVVVMKEGRNFIVKFSASARGCYCEPNYVHFRKLIRGSKEFVDCWWWKVKQPMKNIFILILPILL